VVLVVVIIVVVVIILLLIMRAVVLAWAIKLLAVLRYALRIPLDMIKCAVCCSLIDRRLAIDCQLAVFIKTRL
jgi:hypothetical protein